MVHQRLAVMLHTHGAATRTEVTPKSKCFQVKNYPTINPSLHHGAHVVTMSVSKCIFKVTLPTLIAIPCLLLSGQCCSPFLGVTIVLFSWVYPLFFRRHSKRFYLAMANVCAMSDFPGSLTFKIACVLPKGSS